jgi:hypothetical protein
MTLSKSFTTLSLVVLPIMILVITKVYITTLSIAI